MDRVVISVLDGEFGKVLPLLDGSEELHDRIGPCSDDTWESRQLVNIGTFVKKQWAFGPKGTEWRALASPERTFYKTSRLA